MLHYKKSKTVLSYLQLSVILSLMACGGGPYEEGTDHIATDEAGPTEIEIGVQTWQTSNLTVETFRNGDTLREALSAADWQDAASMKEPAFYRSNSTGTRFYNWYAVNDKRGLAPEGWHIPSNSEWKSLRKFLGDSCDYLLKDGSGWDGSNAYGFSAMPEGMINEKGDCIHEGEAALFWTSSVFEGGKAWCRKFLSDQRGKERTVPVVSQSAGLAVRCIKDELITAETNPK